MDRTEHKKNKTVHEKSQTEPETMMVDTNEDMDKKMSSQTVKLTF